MLVIFLKNDEQPAGLSPGEAGACLLMEAEGAARERSERTARQTERETRDAYLGVLSEMSRVQALKQAVASSQTALQATEAGFEVGTRTTVDVLESRRNLFDAQTNYARSRYDYIINLLRLKIATGNLAEADLQEVNGWLTE